MTQANKNKDLDRFGLYHPGFEVFQQIAKSLAPIQQIFEPFRRSQEQLKALMAPFEQVSQISKAMGLDGIAAALPKLDLMKGLQSFPWLKDLEELNKHIVDLYKSRKRLAAGLHKYGWYMPLGMPVRLMNQLAKHLGEEEKNKIDALMSEFIQAYREEIMKILEDRFPKRMKILRAAFLAHENQIYELSVPVFLSQADGLSFEMLKVSLFDTEKQKPKTSKPAMLLVRDAFFKDYLQPLMTAGPITAGNAELVTYPCRLNRHSVLHGRSVDYATRTNSLKALSLLSYMSEVVYQAWEEKKAADTRVNS